MRMSLCDKISAACAFGTFGLLAWGLTDLHGHINEAIWWLILILVFGCAAVLSTYVVPEYIDRYLIQQVARRRARQQVSFDTPRYPSNKNLAPPTQRAAISGKTWLGALAAITLTSAAAGSFLYRRRK
jgi:hypothetical protein